MHPVPNSVLADQPPHCCRGRGTRARWRGRGRARRHEIGCESSSARPRDGARPPSNQAASLADLRQAHDRYRRRRWAVLTVEDRALIAERGWESSIRDVGVAGLRDETKVRAPCTLLLSEARREGKEATPQVKCLHAHYAHFLGDLEEPRNPVGKWVHQHLPPEIRAYVNLREDGPRESR